MTAEQRSYIGQAWKADRERYPRLAFLLERSIWAVGVLRFGQWVDALDSRVARLFGRVIYQVLFTISETLTGISIPKSVVVGPGLRIFHSGGIVIHERARFGANCTLRHGVTVGVRSADGEVPVIGDNVDIGAAAMILGGITVGDGARIGAGALVQVNVPAGAVAYAPRAVISEASCSMVSDSRSIPHDWPAASRSTETEAALK